MMYLLTPLGREGRGGSSGYGGIENGGRNRRQKVTSYACYCWDCCFAGGGGWAAGIEGRLLVMMRWCKMVGVGGC